jgi:hypothetical protein
MIVILLSSIVVTNLVMRLPLRFPKGSRATKRKRTRKRRRRLENDQSDSSKMSLTEDISRLLKILIETKKR